MPFRTSPDLEPTTADLADDVARWRTLTIRELAEAFDLAQDDPHRPGAPRPRDDVLADAPKRSRIE